MSSFNTTEVKFPLESAQGKALVERFNSLKIGIGCVFPSPMPGLSNDAVQAVLREKASDGKFWEFSLYWHGCDMGAVVAEIKGDQLVLDSL